MGVPGEGARPVVAAGVVNPAAHPCGVASSDRTGWTMSKIFVKDLHRVSAPAVVLTHFQSLNRF